MTEHCFNDHTKETIEARQRQELMHLVWSYTLALECCIVQLRNKINQLDMKQGQSMSYPDPESDFRIRFFQDLPAYSEFQTILESEETDIALPD